MVTIYPNKTLNKVDTVSILCRIIQSRKDKKRRITKFNFTFKNKVPISDPLKCSVLVVLFKQGDEALL